MKKTILFYILFATSLFAQNYTRKDSLQGSLRPERTCYNVLKYNLNIKIDPDQKFLTGYNKITLEFLEKSSKIQLDLFENMQIDSIILNEKKLSYQREFDAVFINLNTNNTNLNQAQDLYFYYHGNPKIAKHAPWDGGFVFTKDNNGNPWIAVAVQGTGASLWYPCKDSQTDEPDYGAYIQVSVPNNLMNISNGSFKGKIELNNGYTQWNWEVKNPINNYDITVNIGKYVGFSENYKGLDLNYYVLEYNLEKAKNQFEQVKPMLDCFQTKFGEYPFKEDGYKLVETPYLGMEHQSAVAYGNKFQNGYLGNDLSRTGVGKKFDYIIIHESGHEWFGNSITSKDIADMWIHEGFTQYSEIVYIECTQDYEKAMLYAKGLKYNVMNDKPIIGPYGVNKEGSGDMYPKGALLLNTLRHVIHNDVLWWKIIYDYATTFKHKIVETKDVIQFFNDKSRMNLTPIFNEYLYYTSIPILELSVSKNKLQYRWITEEPNFEMPIEITYQNNKYILNGTNKIQKLKKLKVIDLKDIEVPTSNYFIKVDKI